MACLQKGVVVAFSVKEVQPGVSMESPLRPACLWLANPAEEQTEGGSFRGCVVCFDL